MSPYKNECVFTISNVCLPNLCLPKPYLSHTMGSTWEAGGVGSYKL